MDLQLVLDLRRMHQVLVTYLAKVSSPSDLSEDTKISKISEKSNTHDFYPKHLNHAFMPKPDFEGYRDNTRITYEDDKYPTVVLDT